MDKAAAKPKRGAGKSKRPPFRIGQSEIAPGQRVTVDIPFADLSTHAPMPIAVHVVHGRRPGPTMFVCAALHGDEINGVEIIRRLLTLAPLKHLRGTLLAVPIVNAFGFVSNSRYLPDRRDLNRSFPGSKAGSLAGRLAYLFRTEVVERSDLGIELHTGAIHRANFPQVRANFDQPGIESLAQAFGIPLIINTGYRDGSLRAAAAAAGIPVIVYEAGEALRFDEQSIRAGVKGVVRVMRSVGMLQRSPPGRSLRKTLVIRSTVWVRAPRSGVLRVSTRLGEQVTAGQVLGLISDPFGVNEIPVAAPTGGIIIGRTNLPLVHEGEALLHIARVEGTQVAARALDEFDVDLEYRQGMTSALSDEPPIV